MSKTRLTIKEVEKKARNSQEYIALQYSDAPGKEELTLEVTHSTDKVYYYFLNSSKVGRKRISQTEAQALLNKYNVYSS